MVVNETGKPEGWLDVTEIAKMLDRQANGKLRERLRKDAEAGKMKMVCSANGRHCYYHPMDAMRWVDRERKAKEEKALAQTRDLARSLPPVAVEVGKPRGVPWTIANVAHEISKLRRDVDFLYQFIGREKPGDDGKNEMYELPGQIHLPL
jgi:hypothetical protein